MDPKYVTFDRLVQDLLALQFSRQLDQEEHRKEMKERYPELAEPLMGGAAPNELLQAFIQSNDLDSSLLEHYDHELHRISEGAPVSPYQDLDKLVGLRHVKQTVKDIGHLVGLHVLRKKRGLTSRLPGAHMVFRGSPGTGKTTVARILGRLLREYGFLSRGHLVECSRAELVAGYMGQTAEKARGVLRQARGGILFVDEAYLLTYMTEHRDYGYEALGTIVKYMDDYREDLVVIFAGYTGEMNRFLAVNPGLRSRVSFYITFPNYDGAELSAIAEKLAQDQEWTFTEEARRVLARRLPELNARLNGNGRLARTIVERTIMQKAKRLATLKERDITDRDLTVLEEVDLCFPDPQELGELLAIESKGVIDPDTLTGGTTSDGPREVALPDKPPEGKPAFK